jgi:hypothetical protein
LDFVDPQAAQWPLRTVMGAPGTFGDSTIEHRLDKTARHGGVDAQDQMLHLARSLELKGAIDVYARTSYAELLSARSGCIVHNPLYPFVDLAALCVRRERAPRQD